MTQPFGEPWYAPARKKQAAQGLPGENPKPRASPMGALRAALKLASGIAALMFAAAAGTAFTLAWTGAAGAGLGVLLCLGGIALMLVSVALLVRQLGVVLAGASQKHASDDLMPLAMAALRGDILLEDSRKGVPAPEMALHQFVQQVRAYATEKSYQKNRQDSGAASQAHSPLVAEPVDLLKRRWNEVLDSLGEFEIYLANDPQGMIQKLIAKYPNQVIDVSQVFRDVAESFDNTWRRKGINIEAAIVTPLRANTNEMLLRRLLVGPWRSCAYFARRGGGVLFSAKSFEGRVVARWECEGLTIHDDYLKFAMQSERTVNERIERGLQVISSDPSSPATLHALISFITWIDLAQTVAADFAFKHTNDGFVVELRLK